MSGAPASNGAPAAPAAPPAKIPMKIAAKIPMGNITVKLPVSAAGAPPAAMSKFVSVIPTRVAVPAPAAVAKAAPKPVVVAAPKPVVAAAPKPTAAPVKRPRIEDDEDDDLNALGGGATTHRSIIPRPSPPVVKKPVVTRAAAAPVVKRAGQFRLRSLLLRLVLLLRQRDKARASQRGIVPINDESLLKEEEEVVIPGAPPRPPIQKHFSADLDSMIERLKKKIAAEEAKLRIKDDNKTISLSTSKINYIDPRIVCAWSKREQVPISRVFAAALQKKFPWALNTGEDYEF
ncbi:DNA topoisomerase I-related protein, putative [Bodo saltans]|uniref:DNA topoisomerase I-related protein, putative n=1 Tax=Bodo saltans TaxID=75058 RepID=A0A0S4JUX7_BODSA|nr:DNA topoisomerase I-related protein, putative [Bodo saltans]|eukprot:CUG93853.1 DNA topoisomerase I-related protein, putative [Bodo saltans]